MKTTDLLVKVLENEGVKYIFGLPGEENLDLLESLRHSSIQFITTRNEQSAGFMAATLGRLTGQPGVCLSTLGPGATNLVTAAAYANLGGMPMVMITGQKPIKNRRQGHFQIIDTVQMMGPVTKLSKQAVSGEMISVTLRELFRTAQEERPGAVHLELPEDIAREDVQNIKIYPVTKTRRPIADEKAITKAVEMIEKSHSPLILIGAGGNRKLISKSLCEFLNKTKIPFFNTQLGKGVIDERNPLYLGTAALSDKDHVHCAVNKSDLIINIGHDVVEKPPFIMNSTQQVIHINFSSAKVDPVYFPTHEVVGDISNSIWQINSKINVSNQWGLNKFPKTKKEAFNSSYPLSPLKIVSDIRSVMPEDGIVTLDNGMYKIWFARNYTTYLPNTLLLDNSLATMGAGFPSAIATKILYPYKKVLSVVGDGGFMMNSQELETAVRLKLNLTILILNDSGYGMIKWKQKMMGFDNFGLDFNNPDFVKYAESFGATGYKIKKTDELKTKLAEFLDKPGVNVIEAPINYVLEEKLLAKYQLCDFNN